MSAGALPVVFNGLQLGSQSGIGTGAVAANKKILGLGTSRLMPKSQGGLGFTGQGDKLQTAHVSPGAHWTEMDFNALLSYNLSCYIFASAIDDDTPSADGTNGKLWEFATSLNAANTKRYYTAEVGNPTRSKRAVDVSVQNFAIAMGKTVEPRISGKMIGGKRIDDVTITGGPTVLSPVLVQPGNWNVKVATAQSGLTGASVFPLAIKADFNVPDLAGTLFRMDSSDTSFAARPEKAIMPTLKFTGGDNDDDYADFVTAFEDGSTRWFRVSNAGAVIAGGVPSQYLFQLDFCGALIEPETPTTEQEAALNEWNFVNEYDGVAGFAFKLSLTNAMASL